MSGSVTIRHGHTINDAGLIHYNESASTFEEGDKLAGKRLDRRRCYCIIDGKVCVSTQWTETCSGCSDGYGHKGMGCSECGYQGMRRNGTWMPLPVFEACERAAREA